ncbi:MAG: hypothetical protein J6I68_11530 [Butyrivibrio sp.]|uniref:hypothetical protein n=1 Tax=Butyrivibrio sp. TaxID=28121 RepID=UPI001B41052D|nr:hypothetical protein [Butyrivibrio sp.]MBP3783867.1 hypothetical protein [Butyrivibrio sp.]
MNDKIFIDFDDTICLHSHRISSRHFITSPPEYIAKKAYEESMLNKKLYDWLLHKQEDPNSKAVVYVMSSASSFMLEAKKIWVSEHCPGLNVLDYIGVSVDVDKTSVLEAYRKVFPREMKMYYIEDSFSERAKSEKTLEGVIIRSPQWIDNL